MDIHQFFELFVGRWRSQRSNHQFGEENGGDSRSLLEIVPLNLEDMDLISICQKHNLDPNAAIHPMRLSWEEESLTSNNKSNGHALVIPLPHDLAEPQKGWILSEQGKGIYEFRADESLTIQTAIDRGLLEERIWYGNPNLRFRIATWLHYPQTSDRQSNNPASKQVRSSKFYSEIRSSAKK